jgi:hypothetical protein
MKGKNTRLNHVRRAVGSGITAIVLAAGGVAAMAAPASAAPYLCSPGEACHYAGYNYAPDYLQTSTYVLDYYYCIDYLGWHGFNDVTSSVYNNGNTDWAYFYKDSYRNGGSPLVVPTAVESQTSAPTDSTIKYRPRTSRARFRCPARPHATRKSPWERSGSRPGRSHVCHMYRIGRVLLFGKR